MSASRSTRYAWWTPRRTDRTPPRGPHPTWQTLLYLNVSSVSPKRARYRRYRSVPRASSFGVQRETAVFITVFLTGTVATILPLFLGEVPARPTPRLHSTDCQRISSVPRYRRTGYRHP